MIEVIVISQVYCKDDRNYITEVAVEVAADKPWTVRFPHKIELGERVRVRV